jgi:hypothetical protein
MIARFDQQLGLRGASDDQSTLGLQYQAHKRLGLEAKASTGSDGLSAQGQAALTVGSGSVYAGERFAATGPEAGATSVFGVQMPVGPGSRVYSEYQWRNTGTGQDVLLIGAQKQMKPASNLVVTVAGEHGTVDNGLSHTRRTAWSGGAAYMRGDLRLETRNEARWDAAQTHRTQFLTANHAEVRLAGGLSLLGHFRWSETRNRDLGLVEARLEEHSIGMALRPLRRDPQMLARYTRVNDQSPATALGASPTSHMDVLAVEGVTNLGSRLQWTAKSAARILSGAGDSLGVRTHSLLVVNRLNARITGPFGAGIEYRLLTQREAGDRRDGWLHEVTWDPVEHLRVGAGFNFASFSDNEFSRNDSSVRGAFLRLQGKY